MTAVACFEQNSDKYNSALEGVFRATILNNFGNLAVHICGIIDIRACASICQSFSRIESLCKSMFIILPMQYDAIFT